MNVYIDTFVDIRIVRKNEQSFFIWFIVSQKPRVQYYIIHM